MCLPPNNRVVYRSAQPPKNFRLPVNSPAPSNGAKNPNAKNVRVKADEAPANNRNVCSGNNRVNRFPCASYITSGGQGVSEFEIDLGMDIGNVHIYWDAYQIPDRFIFSYGGSILVDTGLQSGSGDYTFNKSTSFPQILKVRVEAPIDGTAWEFVVGCPQPA